jgi:hypothetical protein
MQKLNADEARMMGRDVDLLPVSKIKDQISITLCMTSVCIIWMQTNNSKSNGEAGVDRNGKLINGTMN